MRPSNLRSSGISEVPKPVVISAAVEGPVDESVIRRLITHVGATPGSFYGKNGKQDIRRRIQGYKKHECLTERPD